MMRLLAVVAVAVFACSSPPPLSKDEPDEGERALFEHGGSLVATTQAVTQLADSIFHFDPTIVPGAEASENAQNIQRDVGVQLNGCGSAILNGVTVTVQFGAPPGCVLKNGMTVSGTVTVGVSKSGNVTTLVVTLTNVVANGKALSGEMTFKTTTGTTFTLTGNLSTGGAQNTLNLSVTGASNSATLNGTLASVKDGKSSTLQFGSVSWTPGDCYPSMGAVIFKQGVTLNMTVTFNADTASNGVVVVQSGRKEFPMTLPAYGNCPALHD